MKNILVSITVITVLYISTFVGIYTLATISLHDQIISPISSNSVNKSITKQPATSNKSAQQTHNSAIDYYPYEGLSQQTSAFLISLGLFFISCGCAFLVFYYALLEKWKTKIISGQIEIMYRERVLV